MIAMIIYIKKKARTGSGSFALVKAGMSTCIYIVTFYWKFHFFSKFFML